MPKINLIPKEKVAGYVIKPIVDRMNAEASADDRTLGYLVAKIITAHYENNEVKEHE